MTQYTIYDRGDYRKYRIEIPNSIDDMGLSVYAFRLYVHLKRVAGDSGTCYQATSTIAKACKMSAGMVSKAKVELANAGLISITVKPGEHGEFDSHIIEIKDIWPENFAKYSTCSPHEQDPCHDVNRTVSPHETKKEPIKNKHTRAKAEYDTQGSLFPLAQVLAEVTGMDFQKNKGRLFKEAKEFYTAEDTARIRSEYGPGGMWYSCDWRGKKGDLPTLAQIRETWGHLKTQNGNTPRGNGKTTVDRAASKDNTGGYNL